MDDWGLTIGGDSYVNEIRVCMSTVVLSTETIRVRFPGNNVTPYLITGASFTCNGITIPVTANSQLSFYVPAFGRTSDIIDVSTFTLPATATLEIYAQLSIPYRDNIPMVNEPIEPAQSLLILNFNGEDGTTSWAEEAHGVFPVTWGSVVLDTANKKYGTASVRLGDAVVSASGGISYLLPHVITGDVTVHGFVKITNMVNFLASGGKVSITLEKYGS